MTYLLFVVVLHYAEPTIIEAPHEPAPITLHQEPEELVAESTQEEN